MSVGYVKRLAGPYVGDGTGQKTFSFGFLVFEESDVYVAVAADSDSEPADLQQGTDYTVSMNSDQSATPGGTITITSEAGLAKDAVLVIGSAVDYAQTLDLTNYTRFPPERITTELDRIVVMIQQIVELLGRVVQVPPTSSISPKELFYQLIHAAEAAAQSAEDAQEALAACEQIKQYIAQYSWDIPHLVGTIKDVEDYPFDGYFWVPGFGDAGKEGQDISNRVVKAAGSTALRPLSERFADVVNVRDFGAVGDGVTDDTAAIQAALYAASASGKKVFMSGPFLCASDSLCIPSRTSLVGEADARLIRGFATGSSGSKVLARVVPIAGEAQAGDIYMSGITFDGNGVNFGDEAFDILYAADTPVKNLTISRCLFLNCAGFHAIDLNRADKVLISKCRFEGWKYVDTGDYAADRREAIQLDGYDVSDTSNFNKNITVENCYFGRSDAFGPYPTGIGNHGWFDNPEGCSRINIRGNTFDEMSYAGVHVFVWKDTLIAGNVFNKCQNGVLATMRYGSETETVSVPERIVVQGNVFVGNGSASSSAFSTNLSSAPDTVPSSLLPTDIVFSANVVHKTVYGLNLRVGKNVVVEGNTFNGVTTSNIFRMCASVVYSGNTHDKSAGVIIDSKHSTWTLDDSAAIGYIVASNMFKNSTTRVVHAIGANSCVCVHDNAIVDESGTGVTAPYIEINSSIKNSFVYNNVINATVERSKAVSIQNSSEHKVFNNTYYVNGEKKEVYGYNKEALIAESTIAVHTRLDGDGYHRGAFSVRDSVDDSITPILTYVRTPSSEAKSVYVGCTGAVAINTIVHRLSLSHSLTQTDSAFYAQTQDSLGRASNLWSQVYASTGAINTSDERSKTDITDPDEALMRAWGKVKYRLFRFKDAVEKKSGAARIHAGLIAQQVIEAFASEGLDALRYGVVCYDKWDDEYEDIKFVDKPEVLDENGNVISPAVTHIERRKVLEAGDRYGIRYEEADALEHMYERWERNQIKQRLTAAGF